MQNYHNILLGSADHSGSDDGLHLELGDIRFFDEYD